MPHSFECGICVYKNSRRNRREFRCLFSGLEAVLQADAAVEYQMLGGRILAVGAEVTQTHELIAVTGLGILQCGFDLTSGEDLQRIGIQILNQRFHAGSVRIGSVEQIVVQTNLCIHSSLSVDPVDGSALDLAAVGRVTATGLRIVGCQNLGDVAVLVGVVTGALDQVSALQAAFRAVGEQTLVLRNGFSQEVIGLDPQIPGEGDLTESVDRGR